MTIYKTAYDTSAGSAYRLREIQDLLERGVITGAFHKVKVATNHEPDGIELQLLEGGNSSADVIAYFGHPMVIPGQEHNDQPVLAVDVRGFGRWNAANAAYQVRNRPEFAWTIKRAILNHVWLTQRPELLRDLSGAHIPAATYATLVSECIARRFALDNGERLTVSVLAAFFYFGLFSEDRELDQMARNKIYGVISKITHVPPTKVIEIIGERPLIKDLSDFCEQCRTLSGAVQLENLSLLTLTSVVGGAWFGTNARENIIVALEHPPTWIMLVAASLEEATYKSSTLAKVSMRFDKQGAGSNFLKALTTLIGGPDVVAHVTQSD